MIRRLGRVAATGVCALSLLALAGTAAAWGRSRSRTDVVVHIRSGSSATEWSSAVGGFTFCRRENSLWSDEPGWRWETEQPPLAGPRWAPDAGAPSAWRVLGASGARGTRQFFLDPPPADSGFGCNFLYTNPFHEEVTVATVPYWWAALATSLMPGLWVACRRRRRPGVGMCRSCGYDLRATPGRCPECGTAAATGVAS
jgi:hypothetical protein